MPSSIPAHSIKVAKQSKTWLVEILDHKKRKVGSFTFKERSGMKVIIEADAYLANELEDPARYNQLEVSCSYTVFAG